MEHEKSPLKGPKDLDPPELLEELLPRRLFQDNLAFRMRSGLLNPQSPNPITVRDQPIKQITLRVIGSSKATSVPMEVDMAGLPPKAPPRNYNSTALTGAVITASPTINAIHNGPNTTPISPRFTSPPSVRLSRKKEKARGPFAAKEQESKDRDGDGDLSMTDGN